jgi:hypothetical protein
MNASRPLSIYKAGLYDSLGIKPFLANSIYPLTEKIVPPTIKNAEFKNKTPTATEIIYLIPNSFLNIINVINWFIVQTGIAIRLLVVDGYQEIHIQL